jgi:uncharacterized protein (DUF111 family)
MNEEPYFFEPLTREMIVANLKDNPNATTEVAVIARKIIVAAIRGTTAAKASQNPEQSVHQICKGIMEGLLLIEQDLAKAAVQILRNMAEAAQEVHLDPAQMMTWAMEGIAEIAPIVNPQLMNSIQSSVKRPVKKPLQRANRP